MGDIAQDPSKSLIVKLPAKKATKPEGSNFGKNDLNDLATVARVTVLGRTDTGSPDGLQSCIEL